MHYLWNQKVYKGAQRVGKLISRKTTESNISSTKYVRDCFALYLVCNGDSSCLSNVFDKSKQHYYNKLPIQSFIELRSLTQTLLQRVTKLEKAQSSYVITSECLKNQSMTWNNKIQRFLIQPTKYNQTFIYNTRLI